MNGCKKHNFVITSYVRKFTEEDLDILGQIYPDKQILMDVSYQIKCSLCNKDGHLYYQYIYDNLYKYNNLFIECYEAGNNLIFFKSNKNKYYKFVTIDNNHEWELDNSISGFLLDQHLAINVDNVKCANCFIKAIKYNSKYYPLSGSHELDCDKRILNSILE